jgi:GntR family transcriptional repressor for pyruvate dehydrogenase complex
VARTREAKASVKAGHAVGLFDTSRPGGLHERIYSSLIHAIVSGRFVKGSKLPSEPELATTFDVSRPVVRQALEKLRSEGLIESQRGSGNYVVGLDHLIASRVQSLATSPVLVQSMLDDLEFRLMLEPEAAFHAARRRGTADLERMKTAMERFVEAHEAGHITHHYDYLFHEAIAIATTNSRFIDAARSLEYSQDDERILMRHIVHFQPGPQSAEVIREHQAVLELIEAREAERARKAMAEHIAGSRRRLMRHIAELRNDVAARQTPAESIGASDEATDTSH